MIIWQWVESVDFNKTPCEKKGISSKTEMKNGLASFLLVDERMIP